jgi:hypothetical protein
MGLRYDIYPSKTQDEFIMSGALENCIMGPRGEGKTESGIMAMVVHASRQDKKLRPIPWAIVRDTWANLERTTLASFKYPREGARRRRNPPRKLELPELPKGVKRLDRQANSPRKTTERKTDQRKGL